MGNDSFTVGECVDILLYENSGHGECLQLLASKVVGYSIVIVTITLMKMPQIIKILKARSAEGISYYSQLFHLVTTSSACTYSIIMDFPFSTWGESIFLAIQNLIICCLILIYTDRTRAAVVQVAVYVFIMTTLMLPFTPIIIHTVLQLLTLPFLTASRGLQIWANFKNGGTGVLSGISVFTMNFRSLGRLYTHIRETQDPLKIAIYLVASLLNIVMSGQMIYYNKGKPKAKVKKG